MIHLAVKIMDVPRVEVTQRQIVLWCIVGGVSCDSNTRRYVITGVKTIALQCAVPQVLSVASAILLVPLIDPLFLLVDVGKYVDALIICCMGVVKYSQQTSKCSEFLCALWKPCMSDTLEQAVPTKVVDFGGIGSCIYYPLQCTWI